MAGLGDQINVDAEQVIGALENQVGQQAGMIARLQSVVQQLQQRIAELAAQVPADE